MKVMCEYCGSYVEADENMKCPLCLAGLGSAAKAEQQRVEQQEEAERQREAEEKAEEAKENHVSEIIKGVASVASAFVAGRAVSDRQDNDDFFGASQPPDHGDRRRPPEGFDGRPDHHRDHGSRPPLGGPDGGMHPGPGRHR